MISQEVWVMLLVVFGVGMIVGHSHRSSREIGYIFTGLGILWAGLAVIEAEDLLLRVVLMGAGAALAIWGGISLVGPKEDDKKTNENKQDKN